MNLIDKNIVDEMKNYEPRLNQEWVQVLINLRMKYSKAFTRKRHSATEAWKNIYNEMVELGAPPYVSIDKIKKKWMNLIARYKHLKFNPNNNTITWPYFDQIDRAYTRNPHIIELRKLAKIEMESEDECLVPEYADYMMKKQKFTTVLIQLRYAYRHLFTGKKYAAQRGWMVIQNMHPDGQSYTIEQISKCWQNLTQRYRTLFESEKDHSQISWIHFQNMHEIMRHNKSSVNLLDVTDIKKEHTSQASPLPQTSASRQMDNLDIHSETVTDNASDKQSVQKDEYGEEAAHVDEASSSKKRRRVAGNNNNNSNGIAQDKEPKGNKDANKENQSGSGFDDLLKYLIQRDITLDEQHCELVNALKDISNKLDK